MDLHPSWNDKPVEDIIRECGIIGCGGAGFPAYAKYTVGATNLLTNAQESEPGYFIDKWHHQTYVSEYVDLYAYLKTQGIKKIVIAPKIKDRDWFRPLEDALKAEVLDCTGRNRFNLDEIDNDYIFTYTDDRYAFGKEGALLLVSAQVKLKPGEFPGQHGWIVNNSQTLHNIYLALTTGKPVTDKYVHVYGEGKHYFKSTPVGTRCEDLLKASGVTLDDVAAKGFVVLEGGPGWYHEVDPKTFALTRRTNSLIVTDPSYRDHTGKDVLAKPNKPGYPKEGDTFEQAPSEPLTPSEVSVQLQDNAEFDVVKPGVPCVSVGDKVDKGQVIANAQEGISVPVHAPFNGEVRGVSDTAIDIARA